MDLRIGLTQSAKEIEVHLPEDADQAKIKEQVDAALASGSGTLWFTDRKGRMVGVAVEKLAYVDIGPEDERRIGFGG